MPYSINNSSTVSNFKSIDAQLINQSTQKKCHKRLFFEIVDQSPPSRQPDIELTTHNLISSTPFYNLNNSNELCDRRFTPITHTPTIKFSPNTAKKIKKHNIVLQYPLKRNLGDGIRKYSNLKSKLIHYTYSGKP
jgi:hypothetical protein